MKRSQSVSVMMILVVVGLCSNLWGQFAGGSGTEADPYRIETAAHLNNVRNYLGQDNANLHFRQDADIDLGTAPWNEGEGWQPIGSGAGVGEPQPTTFYGNYNGNGKIIRNLTINRPEENDQALFGGLDTGSVVRNLGLIDVNVTGQNTVAGLVARLSSGTIEQCFVTGRVTGRTVVGGINGYKGANYGSAQIRNCYSTAHIIATLNSDNTAAGGITGNQYRGNSQQCLAIGLVEVVDREPSTSRDGALAGEHGHTGAAGLANSYWDLTTTGQLRDVSRYITGSRPGSTTAQLVQAETYQGFDFINIWAIAEGSSYAYLRWEGDEPGAHSLPSYLPPSNLRYTPGQEAINLTWSAPPEDICVPDGYNVYRDNVRVNEQPIEATHYQDRGLENERVYRYTVTAVYDDFESIHTNPIAAVPLADPPEGTGSEEDPFIISNALQLNSVRYLLHPTEPVHFRQSADINLDVAPYNTGEGWPMIEDFNGVYDGQFHTISGLTINTRDSNIFQIGLFYNTTEGAEIRNLGMTNVNIQHTMTAGARNHGAGAIAGLTAGTLIENCYASGFVRGRRNGIGVLVGRAMSGTIIRNCYSTGNAVANHTDAGVGGLVGYLNNSRVENSYSTAKVHNLNVTSSANGVGGLVGWMSNGNDRIINSYAMGEVTAAAPTAIGGLVGRYQAGQITGSFWNVQTTGQENSSGGGTGLETAQMIRQGTYTEAEWEFPDPWNIIDGQTYPFLAFQEDPAHHNIPGPSGLIAHCNFQQNQIRLEWVMPTEPIRYNIYRNNVMIGNSNQTEFVDRNVPLYTEYTYYVTARMVDDNNQQYDTYPSNSVTVTLAEFSAGMGTVDDPYHVRTALHLNNVRYARGAHFRQVADIVLQGEFTRLSDNANRFTGSYNGDGFTITGLSMNANTDYQGLFGYIENATLENIILEEVNITAHRQWGAALAGYSTNSTIRNCSAEGIVLSTNGWSSESGGLIGQLSGGTATDSWTDIERTARYRYLGGFVGLVTDDAVIERCYALGNVENQSTSATSGGFAGRMAGGIINDCFARGSVVSTQDRGYIGGFVGELASGTIRRCYSTGRVEGLEGQTGGFAGRSSGTIQVSYWDRQSSQTDVSYGGEGRTRDSMVYPYADDTYIGWDFDDVWGADIDREINNGYPFLILQVDPNPVTASNPIPENEAANVPDTLRYLGWSYIDHPLYSEPLGFRLYFNTTGQFLPDDDFVWVAYNPDEQDYTNSEILPERLDYATTYYWKVIPTTIDPDDDDRSDGRSRRNSQLATRYLYGQDTDLSLRGDAENCPVWSFTTAINPNPATARNPNPEDEVAEIGLDLEELSWTYEVDEDYTNPVGFRIYLNTSGEFGEDDDFNWVQYVPGQARYSSSAALPDSMQYETTYYWRVVPTTDEPERRGSDGERERRRDGVEQRAESVGTGYYTVHRERRSLGPLRSRISERGDAENCPVWSFTTIATSPNPSPAVNPSPEHQAEGVSPNLEYVSWDYIASDFYEDPVGFRVYMNTIGTFTENSPYIWVDYDSNQESFSSSEILPRPLDTDTIYFWKVVPTTIDPDDDDRTDGRSRRNSQLATRYLYGQDTVLSLRGDAENCPVWRFRTSSTDITEDSIVHPVTGLHPNYPNPFNPETTISFSLAEKSNVTLEIYNSRGQKVITLVDEKLKQGDYSYLWNGTDRYNNPVPSGLYFYRLSGSDGQSFSIVRKMILLK